MLVLMVLAVALVRATFPLLDNFLDRLINYWDGDDTVLVRKPPTQLLPFQLLRPNYIWPSPPTPAMTTATFRPKLPPVISNKWSNVPLLQSTSGNRPTTTTFIEGIRPFDPFLTSYPAVPPVALPFYYTSYPYPLIRASQLPSPPQSIFFPPYQIYYPTFVTGGETKSSLVKNSGTGQYRHHHRQLVSNKLAQPIPTSSFSFNQFTYK